VKIEKGKAKVEKNESPVETEKNKESVRVFDEECVP
jgi:hypothetical protein